MRGDEIDQFVCASLSRRSSASSQHLAVSKGQEVLNVLSKPNRHPERDMIAE